jgi:WD40 repeat protein
MAVRQPPEWLEVLTDVGRGNDDSSLHASIPDAPSYTSTTGHKSDQEATVNNKLDQGNSHPPSRTDDEPWNAVWTGTPSTSCGHRPRPIGGGVPQTVAPTAAGHPHGGPHFHVNSESTPPNKQPRPASLAYQSATIDTTPLALAGGGAGLAAAQHLQHSVTVHPLSPSSSSPSSSADAMCDRVSTAKGVEGATAVDMISTSAPTHFAHWNGDALSHIFHRLDAATLCRCAQVCQQWCNQITHEEELAWHALCVQGWGSQRVRSEATWREEHQRRAKIDRAWLTPSGYTLLPRGSEHKRRRPVECFVVTAAGDVAVSGGGETLVRWDIATGDATLQRSLGASVSCVALCDDSLLVGMATGAVQLHSATNFAPVWTAAGHAVEGSVECCCLCPQDAVTGGGRGGIMVWSRRNGELIAVLRAHREEVRSLHVAIAPGLISFFSTSYDTDIKAWRGSPPEPNGPGPAVVLLLRGHTEDVTCFALSGVHAVSGGSDRTVRLWSAESGLLVHTLVGHAGEVYCVDVHAARIGTGAIAASGDSRSEVRLWNVVSGECMAALTETHIGCVRAVHLGQHRLVSAGDSRRVVVWDLATNGRKAMILSRYCTLAVLCPCTRLCLTLPRSVRHTHVRCALV